MLHKAHMRNKLISFFMFLSSLHSCAFFTAIKYAFFSFEIYLFIDLNFLCRKLTKELCEVVEDFSLVNFTTLDIQVHKLSLGL